jgi:hypothetical protein
MKQINGVSILDQITKDDSKWYSFIKAQMEEIDYGAVDVRLTIKQGKVVAVKVSNEKTYNMQ